MSLKDYELRKALCKQFGWVIVGWDGCDEQRRQNVLIEKDVPGAEHNFKLILSLPYHGTFEEWWDLITKKDFELSKELP